MSVRLLEQPPIFRQQWKTFSTRGTFPIQSQPEGYVCLARPLGQVVGSNPDFAQRAYRKHLCQTRGSCPKAHHYHYRRLPPIRLRFPGQEKRWLGVEEDLTVAPYKESSRAVHPQILRDRGRARRNEASSTYDRVVDGTEGLDCDRVALGIGWESMTLEPRPSMMLWKRERTLNYVTAIQTEVGTSMEGKHEAKNANDSRSSRGASSVGIYHSH
jgi:hypothetical protein